MIMGVFFQLQIFFVVVVENIPHIISGNDAELTVPDLIKSRIHSYCINPTVLETIYLQFRRFFFDHRR